MGTSSRPASSFHRDERRAAVPIWNEALAGFDWLTLRASPIFYGWGAPRGNGAPVVVVPGFLGTDLYLLELYWWLGRIGYTAHLSRIGRNAECIDLLVDRLFESVDRAHADSGRKVHLIGHSLGGLLARAAASRRPDPIASVITLGSPFRGVRSHPLVMKAASTVRARIRRRGDRAPECFTGYCGCDSVRALGTLPPVPQIAIYTRSDGIVDWRACVNDDPNTDFEVPGTHVGLVFNPAVYRLIAARLAATAAESTRAPVHSA